MFGKNKQQGGFTLMELLVVIAIIGILSTIAVAQLRGGVDKARAAKNGSEIKQLALALRVWMGDYGNHWMSECEIQDEFHDPSNGVSALFCEGGEYPRGSGSCSLVGGCSNNAEPTIDWFANNTDFSNFAGSFELSYEYDNDGDAQSYDSNGCMIGNPYHSASLYIQGVTYLTVVDGLIDGANGDNCGRFVWDGTPERGIWKLGFTQDDF
ncbi:type II secretion system protein [Candidatus Parcubacteria bacterium]|jgi:prepilin-type N-terminal cleavage/methylation domain-containing protein|nr:type II secretion system protein [Candidatus Parcubacteria bacterium]